MPMHFRLADTLCEAHSMACTQKKADIAEIILHALEMESKAYGASQQQKRNGKSLLSVAQARHQKFKDGLQL